MGLLSFSLFLVAFANISLGFLVFIRNTNNRVNRRFGYLAGSVALWALGLGMFLLVDDETHALFWSKIFYVAALLIALTLLLFVKQSARDVVTSKIPDVVYVLPIAILSVVTLFLPEFLTTEIAYQTWGKEVLLSSPEYALYSVIFVSYYVIALRILYKKMRSSVGRTRKQMTLLLYSSTFAGLFGSIFNLILPWLGNYRLIWIGPQFSFLFVGLTFYAIIKHRLFDVRLIVARSVAYVLLLATLSLAYIAVVFGVSDLFFEGASVTGGQQFVYIMMALFVATTAQPLKNFFDHLTNSLFYRDAYDTQEVLNDISDMIVQEVEMSALSERVLDELKQELKTEHAHLLIISNKGIEVFDVGRPLSKEEALRVEDISVYTEGIYLTDEMDENDTKKLLSRLNVAVFVRLMTKDETVGFLALGPKLSGNIYNSEDVKLLQIMSNDLAVALQNARRFEEIEAFNITLKKEVDDATRELRKSNEKLKALDEAKDEFISMASHQLRTPLTSIKGYVSMVMEGDAGKINSKQKELLGSAFTSSQRMVFLISDMLNVSRLKTGKFIIESKVIDLVKLIESEVEQLIDTAKGRKLTLTFDKPKDFPKVQLDESKTRQVVMNFIDNAIYYTPAGGHITVALKQEGKSVELTVTDSGIGIPKASQHRLFTKFYRANNARKARPDGTGLGLFMAKKVIIAQGGTIIFHSEEGKGSTFGFRFPLAKIKADESENPAQDEADKPDKN